MSALGGRLRRAEENESKDASQEKEMRTRSGAAGKEMGTRESEARFYDGEQNSACDKSAWSALNMEGYRQEELMRPAQGARILGCGDDRSECGICRVLHCEHCYGRLMVSLSNRVLAKVSV